MRGYMKTNNNAFDKKYQLSKIEQELQQSKEVRNLYLKLVSNTFDYIRYQESSDKLNGRSIFRTQTQLSDDFLNELLEVRSPEFRYHLLKNLHIYNIIGQALQNGSEKLFNTAINILKNSDGSKIKDLEVTSKGSKVERLLDVLTTVYRAPHHKIDRMRPIIQSFVNGPFFTGDDIKDYSFGFLKFLDTAICNNDYSIVEKICHHKSAGTACQITDMSNVRYLNYRMIPLKDLKMIEIIIDSPISKDLCSTWVESFLLTAYEEKDNALVDKLLRLPVKPSTEFFIKHPHFIEKLDQQEKRSVENDVRMNLSTKMPSFKEMLSYTFLTQIPRDLCTFVTKIALPLIAPFSITLFANMAYHFGGSIFTTNKTHNTPSREKTTDIPLIAQFAGMGPSRNSDIEHIVDFRPQTPFQKYWNIKPTTSPETILDGALSVVGMTPRHKVNSENLGRY